MAKPDSGDVAPTRGAKTPTMRRRELGQSLRRLREEARKTPQEAAAWLDVKQPTISKIENGSQRILLRHVRLLCQLYGVESPMLQALEELARQADQVGWWAAYGDTVPEWFKSYLDFEADAEEIWTYESELVPGLLQTADYVAAVARAARPNRSEADVARAVELRMARQKRLTGDRPPQLHVVLNEAVLRRKVGGVAVMRDQLTHLAEMAALPHVTVQVLTFDAGAHPAMISPFVMLRFAEAPQMSTVYIENGRGSLYLERPGDLALFTEQFDQLKRIALTSEASVDLLATVAKQW